MGPEALSSLNPINYDLLKEKASNNGLQKANTFKRILEGALGNGEPTGDSDDKDDKLLDVCYELETIFVGSMLDTMKSTVHESGFFGKSIVKDIFSDMLYDEYAKLMARSDQFGLAREIYSQLRV